MEKETRLEIITAVRKRVAEQIAHEAKHPNTPPQMPITPPPDPPGPGAHHADLRLRKRVTFGLSKPKVEDFLKKLSEHTSVGLARADAVPNEHPIVPNMSYNGVPAWEIMDYVAASKHVDGHWEKDGDGYRLLSNGAKVPLPPEVVKAAEHRFQMEIIVAVGVLLTLVIAGLLLFKWRRSKRAG
jgi:hypothetical protein